MSDLMLEGLIESSAKAPINDGKFSDGGIANKCFRSIERTFLWLTTILHLLE